MSARNASEASHSSMNMSSIMRGFHFAGSGFVALNALVMRSYSSEPFLSCVLDHHVSDLHEFGLDRLGRFALA